MHCGSRGLGHQIGTEFLRDIAALAGLSRKAAWLVPLVCVKV